MGRGPAVTIVDEGGAAFTQVDSNGAPATVVDERGVPITLVESGGVPIELFNPDGTPYAGGGTVPAQFSPGDWSIADLGTGGDARITITALPSDGGSAITDLQYSADGGAWTTLGGTTTGPYDIGGLVDGVLIGVVIRAVNAVGNGPASNSKAVTPTAPLWTPLLLAGNNRLINPTDASSLTMVSTKVGQINDLGGQQNILQGTDANRPTVANGLLVFTAAASMWMTQKGGRSHANVATASTTYQMPDVVPSDVGKGFTNTGLAPARFGRYWVGNHGRKLLSDVTWDASAVLLDADLITAHAVISLTSLSLTQGSVQGVVEAPDGTLWFGICTTAGRGLAHVQVNYDGSNNYVSHELIAFWPLASDPNGVAYDTDLDAVIWCPSGDNPLGTWMHPTTGATIKTRTLAGGTKVDQIQYRSPGLVYCSRDDVEFINVADADAQVTVESYTLTANNAAEGIIFSDDNVLICNDGYIHNATPFLNQIKRYPVNAKPRNRLGTKFALHGVVQLPGGPPGTRAVYSAGQPLSTTLPGFGLFIPSGTTTVLRVFANNRSCNFTVPALTTALAYLAKVDLVAGSVEMFINGTSIGTQSLTGTASNASIDRYAPLMLDGYENVTTLTTGMSVNIGITGDIAGELTADEADRVMAWDAWQYATAIPGLLTALSASNPYKAAPPTA